jgi:hypothetical protein
MRPARVRLGLLRLPRGAAPALLPSPSPRRGARPRAHPRARRFGSRQVEVWPGASPAPTQAYGRGTLTASAAQPRAGSPASWTNARMCRSRRLSWSHSGAFGASGGSVSGATRSPRARASPAACDGDDSVRGCRSRLAGGRRLQVVLPLCAKCGGGGATGSMDQPQVNCHLSVP